MKGDGVALRHRATLSLDDLIPETCIPGQGDDIGQVAAPLVTVGSFSLVPGRWMDGAGPLAASCGTGLSCFDWGLQAAPRLRWTVMACAKS